MNAIFPIHKKYSDLIFSGEKDIEFRNIRTKLQAGDKVYVYETKNGGCGMVVGYFVCGEIEEIPYHKVGTYAMLEHWVNKYGTEEEKEAVHDAMEVHFNTHDDCLIFSYMFCKELIEKMKITHEPVDSMEMWLWPNENKRKEYEKNRQKTMIMLDACDRWLKKIGYYNNLDESYWKYQFKIAEYKKFNTPISITEFKLLDGRQITKAPQNFCYTNDNIFCEND